MDNHEVCRARILKLEAALDAAAEDAADLEMTIAEKDELIASLTAELMRYITDRGFVA